MPHSLNKYRLDYTIWAAYRAAQAGSSKAKGCEFTSALKTCGVIKYIDNYDQSNMDQADFDELHRKWCKSIIGHIKKQYEKDISYGIAAKLVGVFLKGYFILANNEKSSLSKVIHPPIDSYLLKGIDANKSTNFSDEYKWQKLGENDYFVLLNKLCKYLRQGEPLWYLEEYWVLS